MKTNCSKNRTDKNRTKQSLVNNLEQPHLPEPTYDKSAVMKAAWREWKYARAKGWPERYGTTFSECLRIAHGAHAAYQRRAIFAAQGLRLVA